MIHAIRAVVACTVNNGDVDPANVRDVSQRPFLAVDNVELFIPNLISVSQSVLLLLPWVKSVRY